MANSEFTVQGAYQSNQRNALRWILSHVWRYKVFALAVIVFGVIDNIAYAFAPVAVGNAAEAILNSSEAGQLLTIALSVLVALIISGIGDLLHALSLEVLAQRLEMSAREELYRSLLGKSQTFHDRQRVGDIMARATDDVMQLNMMLNPGLFFIFNTILGIIMPLLFMASLRLELLLVPAIFLVTYVIALQNYMKQLSPVAFMQREQFGKLNAGLEESITGIELVKASVQERAERRRFYDNARRFRDHFVQQGNIEARYLPVLLFGIALGFGFLHALVLFNQNVIGIPEVIAFMGLFNLLRFPIFISIFSFGLVQMGIVSADRLLSIITAETEVDENKRGHSAEIVGKVEFENMTFSYDDGKPVLSDISFHIDPGQTVAIVGQTGSGKSALTQLINRTYDATAGNIRIDGVDVREWNLTALRSQISKIEQDVFLFSRTLAENIAFGAPNATQEQIEFAAREAQAHDFIMNFKDGYQTKVGERGVTLSGGQRQRIALARAFLSNPHILILDDSTSAIDSATEDEIQKALRRAQEGRTTFLITHRLSQIRWADLILVLERGRLVACGSHDDLLRRSEHYRRIFARYDVELPPLETEAPVATGD